VGKVAPISNDERRARIERAKELMAQNKIDAIVLANDSTSSVYFADIRLNGGERLWALAIPAKGKPFVACPAFENARAHELLSSGPFASDADVLTWQEDESPFELVVKGLGDRGIATGRVGLDENMKFVFSNSLAKAGPQLTFVVATPVTAGCRMIKDAHEMECLRTASAATLAVYKAVYQSLREGMTTTDVRGLIAAAYDKVGLPGEASLNIGTFTSSPHGSRQVQTIREGTVLMVHGRGLSVGHYADVCAGQADGEDEECVRGGASGAAGGAGGGKTWSAAGQRRQGCAEGDCGCRVWARVQVFFASRGTRAGDGWARVAVPGDERYVRVGFASDDASGDGVLGRAGYLYPWGVWDSA
jgi:hypothetical protein